MPRYATDQYVYEEHLVLEHLREHGEVKMWDCVNQVADQIYETPNQEYTGNSKRTKRVIFELVNRLIREEKVVRLRRSRQENSIRLHVTLA